VTKNHPGQSSADAAAFQSARTGSTIAACWPTMRRARRPKVVHSGRSPVMKKGGVAGSTPARRKPGDKASVASKIGGAELLTLALGPVILSGLHAASGRTSGGGQWRTNTLFFRIKNVFVLKTVHRKSLVRLGNQRSGEVFWRRGLHRQRLLRVLSVGCLSMVWSLPVYDGFIIARSSLGQ